MCMRSALHLMVAHEERPKFRRMRARGTRPRRKPATACAEAAGLGKQGVVRWKGDAGRQVVKERAGNTRTHVCTHMHTHECTHTNTRMYAHTQTHTHTHTHTK